MFRTLVTITALAAVSLTACGGDEQSDAGAATDASASTSTTAEDPTTADEPEPTEASSSDDPEAWCLAYDAPLDVGEEDDLQTVYEAFQVRDEAMAAVAPAEIADASEVVVGFGRTLIEHLESYDWDPDAPRLDVQLEREHNEAIRELTAYAESNC